MTLRMTKLSMLTPSITMLTAMTKEVPTATNRYLYVTQHKDRSHIFVILTSVVVASVEAPLQQNL
jgi:hypothetical protein